MPGSKKAVRYLKMKMAKEEPIPEGEWQIGAQVQKGALGCFLFRCPIGSIRIYSRNFRHRLARVLSGIR